MLTGQGSPPSTPIPEWQWRRWEYYKQDDAAAAVPVSFSLLIQMLLPSPLSPVVHGHCTLISFSSSLTSSLRTHPTPPFPPRSPSLNGVPTASERRRGTTPRLCWQGLEGRQHHSGSPGCYGTSNLSSALQSVCDRVRFHGNSAWWFLHLLYGSQGWGEVKREGLGLIISY